MRSTIIILSAIFILSCSENKTNEEETFSDLWKFNKEENTWLKTRIYPRSIINDDSDFSIIDGNDYSIVLYSDFFHHQPGTMDDEYWRETVIVIHNTNELKIDKVYTIPNDLIHIKMQEGGAWYGCAEIFNLKGLIKFEHLSNDNALIKMKLKGQRYYKNQVQQADSLHFELNFYKNGISEYEYNEKIEQEYFDRLFENSPFVRKNIPQQK